MRLVGAKCWVCGWLHFPRVAHGVTRHGCALARRFVGLLLVTKLLPQGSDEAVRAVVDALGMRFIQRLLLPLQRPGQVQMQEGGGGGWPCSACPGHKLLLCLWCTQACSSVGSPCPRHTVLMVMHDGCRNIIKHPSKRQGMQGWMCGCVVLKSQHSRAAPACVCLMLCMEKWSGVCRVTQHAPAIPQHPQARGAEALHQQAMSCGLGLAILAAACRLPDVAAGEDLHLLLPALVQVRCGLNGV